ncbi:hypothetical protein [Nonomuraea soli]|uniref:Uncharacterized protein n=1 Tax=Nonomuraea soli TaxID=1032476 RepID=A0A7W0CV94_9ACTN|nr:hypothetical protein [Nonomuraea soli]MBA2898006.1 hypothetical protein [Nonomuraea soli]
MNALRISEQQATQAAQQFANRVTAPPPTTSGIAPGHEEGATLLGAPDDNGMMLFQVRLRNTNSMPVVVEGMLSESPAGGDPLAPIFLILNLPACTEGTFETSGSEHHEIHEVAHARVQLYTKNALDGRQWTVPRPGQQAQPVETAVEASVNHSSVEEHRRPRQSKLIAPCA